MGTMGIIAITDKTNPKLGNCISVHWDGDACLSILKEYYDTEDKADELINLGDLSTLGKYISPIHGKHTFYTPQKDVTVAYIRDRQDPDDIDDCKPEIYKLSEIRKCDYAYIFDRQTKEWNMYKHSRKVKDKT